MSNIDAITILRFAQVLLSLIALGLNTAVIDWFNTHESVSTPGYAVFLAFASVWTILISVPYTTFCPPYFPSYTNRYSSLAFELITTLFWFSGFIAGAVYLGTIKRCGGLMCSNARAGVVFAALIFACYCVTSYFPIYYTFFDDENRAMGEHNFPLGMSGAQKVKRIKTKNNVGFAGQDSEHARAFGRFTGLLREKAATAKVRVGNVVGEWKVKAGRRESPPQMSEQNHSGNMV